ncbi:MAG: hypothetical protein ACRD0P_09050 [Stackebrandtia sp.]
MKITREQRQWSGRHRWSGEKAALMVLGAVVALALVIGTGMWVFGGDEQPTADTASQAATSSGSSKQSESKSSRSDPGDAETTNAKKYKPGKNPHSAQEVCGAGFSVIDELTIETGGTKLGTVQLLYDSKNKVNCVVTLKSVDIGKKTAVTAALTPKGGKAADDEGKFGYYAGPVRRDKAKTCVTWGGSIDGVEANSGGWEHCD